MDKLSKELLNTVKQAYNLTDKEFNAVLKQYKQSKGNIEQFIANLFMRYGDNGELDYDEYLRKHERNTIAHIIDEANTIATIESSIAVIVLGAVMNHTYNKSAYHIERNLKVGINFKLLRPEFITTAINYNWSGIPFLERIWSNRESLVRSLRQELATGLKNGESIDKMARRINKQFNVKAYESKRLMRTESARIIGEAQEQIYEDSKVVKEVMWLATLETNTCDECGSLDSKRFRLDDDNKPTNPLHPNCKCCYVPIPFEDYEQKVRKDNETKEIIPYQSYKEWSASKGIK